MNQQEMQKSYFALKYAMSVLIVVGVTIFLIKIIVILGTYQTDIGIMGENFGSAIITLMYTMLINLFLFPIKGLLHNKITRYFGDKSKEIR